jgi:hypothetical protein
MKVTDENGTPARGDKRAGVKPPPSRRNGNTSADNAQAVKEALVAANRVWYVTPLKRQKNTWRLKDWQDTNNSCDEAQIRAWAKKGWVAGFAVVTGDKSGVVVLDLDPRNYTDESRLKANELVSTLPKTMVVQTPGGGTHHYFESPTIGGVGKYEIAPGIEVLGNGASAALPGSVREDGTYKLKGRIRRLAPLPGTLLRAPESASETRAAPEGYYQQGKRNNGLASVAGKLRRDGVGEQERVVALQALNDTLCKPPLEDRVVREIAVGMNRYDDMASAVEEAKFRIRVQERAKSEVAGERAPKEELPSGTGADYLAEESKPLRYTIAEWHPTGGNTVLSASSTARKTTLGINMMKSLVDGVPFLGKYEMDFPDGNVSFWDFEMIEEMFKHWVRTIDIAHPERMARPLHLRGKSNPLLHEELAIEWLRAHNTKAWILDPGMGAWRGYVDNENNNSQMDHFTSTVDRIKVAAEVQDVFVFHHMGSAAKFTPEGDERGRGATRLEDWADHIWLLTNDDERAMWAKGRGVNIPHDEAVHLQFNRQTYELVTNTTRKNKREDEAAYAGVDALVSAGEGVKTEAWRDAITRKYRSDYLEAVKRDWVERRKEGQALVCYLTEAGKVAHSRRITR